MHKCILALASILVAYSMPLRCQVDLDLCLDVKRCAASGDGQTIIKLLETGAINTHICDKLFRDAILTILVDKGHQEPTSGQIKIITTFIKHGADVNARDDLNYTVLFAAVRYGNIKIIQLLIDHGADVNARNRFGEAPLHTISPGAAHEAIELLIKYGADVNAQGNDGETPLHVAAALHDLQAVQVLLAHGADVNAKQKPDVYYPYKGDATPLLLAILYAKDFQSVKHVVHLLLDHGADVHAKNGHGETPLHLAASHEGNQDLIQLLIDCGADIEARDNDIWGTPFHRAVTHGDPHMVQVFIDNGADVNIRGGCGRTPLVNAVIWNKYATVQLLIEHGADVNASDDNRETPLDSALWWFTMVKKDPRVILEILQSQEGEDARRMIALLINHGGKLNKRKSKKCEQILQKIAAKK